MSVTGDDGLEPGTTAVGTWSGGRFMNFGEKVDEERLETFHAMERTGVVTTMRMPSPFGIKTPPRRR